MSGSEQVSYLLMIANTIQVYTRHATQHGYNMRLEYASDTHRRQ